MYAPSLTIRTLNAALHTGSTRQDAMVRRGEVETVLDGQLPRALSNAAEGPLRTAGEGVAVLDRLDVHVSLVRGEPPAEAAKRWARAIVDKLKPALRDPDIRFADAAAHLACFVDAARTGRRDNRAAFRPFSGFAAMPGTMAARAALTAPGAPTLAALSRLSTSSLKALIAGFTPSDAEQVLQAVYAANPDGTVSLALDRPTLTTAAHQNTSAAAILILAAKALRTPANSDVPVAHETALVFAACLRATAGAAKTGSLQAASNTARTHEALGKMAPNIDALTAFPELRDALDSLQHSNKRSDQKSTTHSPAPTRFAGYALLIPTLADFLCEADLPMETPETCRLCLDLLTNATGDETAADDPALRLICGLPIIAPPPEPAPDLLELVASSHEVPADPDSLVSALLSHFAANLRGFEAASRAFLRDSFLGSAGTYHSHDKELIITYDPPPLAIVLSASGRDRSRRTLPWTRDTILDVRPEVTR